MYHMLEMAKLPNSCCCNEGINKKKVFPNQLPMAVQRGGSLHRHLSCLLKSVLT